MAVTSFHWPKITCRCRLYRHRVSIILPCLHVAYYW